MDSNGRPEIHYTTVYRAFRQWSANGCFTLIFFESVSMLARDNLLDLSIIHGDGTSTSTIAKKGGDNVGFSGHKHFKGDKVVAFCDRNCNVIAPFVSAAGNRNESPLLRDAKRRSAGANRSSIRRFTANASIPLSAFSGGKINFAVS